LKTAGDRLMNNQGTVQKVSRKSRYKDL